jgi:hypothetical protein
MASEARLRALGGNADFLEDASNARRWYGSLVDYPGRATMEFGTWNHSADDSVTGRGGALHVQFDEAGRWGVGGIHWGENLPAPDPGGWIRLLYAREFGPVALGLTFLGTSHSAADNGDEFALTGESRFTHDLGLGARFDLSDQLYVDLAAEALDAEVDYYDNDNGITREDLGGWHGFGLRARAFHAVADELAMVYRVDWRRETRPITDPDIGGLTDLDADIFAGGIGFTMLLDPDVMVLVSSDYQRREDERDAVIPFVSDWERIWRLWWRLDVRVGLETRILPWLTLRGATGYRRTVDESLQRLTWSEEFAESHYEYLISVDVPIAVGVGVHLGTLDLDLTYGEEKPFVGGQAVAMPRTRDDRATTLSLSYGF